MQIADIFIFHPKREKIPGIQSGVVCFNSRRQRRQNIGVCLLQAKPCLHPDNAVRRQSDKALEGFYGSGGVWPEIAVLRNAACDGIGKIGNDIQIIL